jgi:hypothetical protein
MYTIEQIKKVEPTAESFEETNESVVISTAKGQMLVSKVLVESKNKKYACMTCGAAITLKKNPSPNYASHYPKKWLKFNLDGTEHNHKKKVE